MTVCERCGTPRDSISTVCPSCAFAPKSLQELATAALLTSQFEAGGQTYGTPETALERIATGIRAGQAPVLDQAELSRHEQTVKAFLEVTNSQLIRGVWLIFRPAVILLAGLATLLFILRALSR